MTETKDIDVKQLAVWALGQSTGMSAKCIARHMMGMDVDGSYPHDGGDFRRCEDLMDAVPGIKERMPEMAGVNQYWAALVPRWSEIQKSKDKSALIRSIVRPKQKADPNHIQLSERMSVTIGHAK